VLGKKDFGYVYFTIVREGNFRKAGFVSLKGGERCKLEAV